MAKAKKAQAASDAPEVLSCDGHTFKSMIRAGMGWLEQNYQKVNALNVFPVPDGDTGTNMLLTMRNAWKEIVELEETRADVVAEKVYNGALMGARGNSGVILSQLMLGFSQGMKGRASFEAPDLVHCLQTASQTADNVRGMKPVEGTILTVARDGASAAETALVRTRDMRAILNQVVEEMYRSVDRTPDLLVKDGEYILKKAGVVDAGGMGLAFIIEGMLKCLNGEATDASVAAVLEEEAAPEGEIDLRGLEYPYDIQFLLIGDNLDIESVTKKIESMGDSALVAGDSKLIKVHVHVKNPGVPLGYAAELGHLTDVVVENMRLQYEQFVTGGGPQMPEQDPMAPPEIAPGAIAAVTVAPSDELARIFYSVGAGRVIAGGQTMNPSTEEIVEAINSLPTDKIVVLPNNKNIMLSAEQAAQFANGKQTVVIPTTTIPQGIAALLALDPHGDLHDVAGAMQSASQGVETGEVTTATRNVTLDGVTVKQGQIIGLHNDILRVAGERVEQVVLDLLAEMGAADLELLTFYYGAGITQREAETLIQEVSKHYPDHEIELQKGAQAHYFYIISAE